MSAQPVAGKAVDSKPAARKINSEVSVVIVTGTAVTTGDRITTDAAGLVHLVFSDETKLVVGPRSSLLIESYLLRSKSRANNFTIRALGGSFRMFTGKSSKKAYKIKTPTATIGVRGTTFDLSVQRNGATRVVLFDGAATVCGNNGRCEVLNRPCAMAEASPRRNVRLLEDERTKVARVRRDFPFIVSQRPLQRGFRVSLRGCPDQRTAPEKHDPAPRLRQINDRVIVVPPAEVPEPGFVEVPAEVLDRPAPVLDPGPAPVLDPGPAPVLDPGPAPVLDPISSETRDPGGGGGTNAEAGDSTGNARESSQGGGGVSGGDSAGAGNTGESTASGGTGDADGAAGSASGN
ncbi:FecR domain-containing protein [Rhizobiales bacterium]|uniref:FecR domain-containing protein n=1 Tax=Hongsoonwoonella zoysiae TaxID=2821844 RepID=UPI001560C7D3|nr:FecR domain-containing protein [Hongsoonwoonella zoysiae]